MSQPHTLAQEHALPQVQGASGTAAQPQEVSSQRHSFSWVWFFIAQLSGSQGAPARGGWGGLGAAQRAGRGHRHRARGAQAHPGKFERGVSDRHHGGLGLGLYITREVVEARA